MGNVREINVVWTLVFVLFQSLLISAVPQYRIERRSQNFGTSQNYYGNSVPTSELTGSAASFGSGSFSNSGFSSSPSGFGGGGGGFSGGGGSGARVECQRQEVSPGRFKFNCEGANPEALAVRSEHILWLSGPAGQKQVLDIEVPNYKIEELIKAGFKTSPGEGTLINLLLRRPQQTYDAQVDTINSVAGTPQVNLQYEPVQKTLVHFPTDKAYSPLQGPLIPPGGGGGGRFQRQNGHKA